MPDVVVVGASAGGVAALRDFVGALPLDLPAAVVVVLHASAEAPALLPEILGRAGPLPVRLAEPSQALTHGVVVVPPPDHHLVIAGGQLVTTSGPRENGHRPSVDLLFKAAAQELGARVVAVVLSGALDDGTAGAGAVAAAGGLVLVQDPSDAAHPSMPQHVLDAVRVQAVGTPAELGALVAVLVRSPPERVPAGVARTWRAGAGRADKGDST